MNSFEKLLLSLDSYRNEINKIGNRYQEESKSNQKFFGSAVFDGIQNDTKKLYKSEFDKTRNAERAEINSIFDSIHTSLESYICRPVRNRDLLSTITTAHNMGITFSASELEYFNNSIGNTYLGNKIITALAKQSGVNTIPLEVNDLDSLTRSIKNSEVSVNHFLDFFSGTDCQAYDLLDSEQLNNPLSSAFSGGAADSEIFKSDSTILQSCLLFDENDIPCSINNKTLTSGDKQIINFMFQDCQTKEDRQSRAADLISQNSDLKPIFELDPEIKEVLSEPEK